MPFLPFKMSSLESKDKSHQQQQQNLLPVQNSEKLSFNSSSKNNDIKEFPKISSSSSSNNHHKTTTPISHLWSTTLLIITWISIALIWSWPYTQGLLTISLHKILNSLEASQYKYPISFAHAGLSNNGLQSSTLEAFNGLEYKDMDFNKSCPQVAPLPPSNGANLTEIFGSEEFRNWSLSVLQAAVRVPTESFDDLGPVGKDPRWTIFYKFEAVLAESFPLTHRYLKLDHVNTHGLVYTWEGTNPDLKPSLFMAHQDVVPVLPSSRYLWKYDPYEAYFDGTNVWGRGSSDDKGSLIAVLEAVETLLKQKPKNDQLVFKPRRTMVLAFGFDEEISGEHGAAKIAQHLEEKYGPKSFFSVIDEGGLGVVRQKGVSFALPGVSEKGMYDTQVVLSTPGGHSSLPPDHTGIGIISQLAVLMEDTPFIPQLTTKSPIYNFLQCMATYSDQIPQEFKKAIRLSGTNSVANKLVVKALAKQRQTKYMLQTSEAIDIIHGGLKVNALPEKVTLVANHRIALESNVEETRNKVIDNVLEIADKFGLGVTVNRSSVSPETGKVTSFSLETLRDVSKVGNFEVLDFGEFIEPAPLSPVEGESWEILSGTIKHVFESFGGPIVDPFKRVKNRKIGNTATSAVDISSSSSSSLNGNSNSDSSNNNKNNVIDHTQWNGPVVVAPALMLANTDTKHYWRLSDNIYRFSPARILDGTMNNIHTVDEFIPLDVHIEAAAFYYTYILNL